MITLLDHVLTLDHALTLAVCWACAWAFDAMNAQNPLATPPRPATGMVEGETHADIITAAYRQVEGACRHAEEGRRRNAQLDVQCRATVEAIRTAVKFAALVDDIRRQPPFRLSVIDPPPPPQTLRQRITAWIRRFGNA